MHAESAESHGICLSNHLKRKNFAFFLERRNYIPSSRKIRNGNSISR